MKDLIKLVVAVSLGALTVIGGAAIYTLLQNRSKYEMPACFLHKKETLLLILKKETKEGYQGRLCNPMTCIDFVDSFEEVNKLIEEEFNKRANCATGELI